MREWGGVGGSSGAPDVLVAPNSRRRAKAAGDQAVTFHFTKRSPQCTCLARHFSTVHSPSMAISMGVLNYGNLPLFPTPESVSL